MKKLIFKLLIFSLLILNSPSYSQDTVSAKYFPLNVGNTWVYYVNTFPPLENPIKVSSITKDTLINGHKYFFYNSFRFSYEWIRYDSLTGNLIFYSGTENCSVYNNDKIIDSLSSNVGDIIYCDNFTIFTRECTMVSSNIVYNELRSVKRFDHDGLVFHYIEYTEGIGLTRIAFGEPPPNNNNYDQLLGCVIDGVVYGDTTLTSIHQIGNSVPAKFNLFQNFPNPFNPNTVISYDLQSTGFAKLRVFDVLGNEVATLVNEKQNAGSYNVNFDGSNFSSGVYFYRLDTGDFSDTKRMILIK